MTEVTLVGHHVVEKVLLDFLHARLILNLDEVRVLHVDLKLDAGFLEMIQDTVGLIEERSISSIAITLLLVLVDHDPLFLVQMLWLMDGSTLHRLLRALDDLIAIQDHLWGVQDEAVKLNGRLLDLKAPLLDRLLHGQLADHFLDHLDLLLG